MDLNLLAWARTSTLGPGRVFLLVRPPLAWEPPGNASRTASNVYHLLVQSAQRAHPHHQHLLLPLPQNLFRPCIPRIHRQLHRLHFVQK